MPFNQIRWPGNLHKHEPNSAAFCVFMLKTLLNRSKMSYGHTLVKIAFLRSKPHQGDERHTDMDITEKEKIKSTKRPVAIFVKKGTDKEQLQGQGSLPQNMKHTEWQLTTCATSFF